MRISEAASTTGLVPDLDLRTSTVVVEAETVTQDHPLADDLYTNPPAPTPIIISKPTCPHLSHTYTILQIHNSISSIFLAPN